LKYALSTQKTGSTGCAYAAQDRKAPLFLACRPVGIKHLIM